MLEQIGREILDGTCAAENCLIIYPAEDIFTLVRNVASDLVQDGTEHLGVYRFHQMPIESDLLTTLHYLRMAIAAEGKQLHIGAIRPLPDARGKCEAVLTR